MNRLKRQTGQSLVELLVAMGVFTIGATAILFLVLEADVSSWQGVERTKAVWLAKEGLEVVRAIRDNDFNDLTDGVHGISLSDEQWQLAGGENVQDQFTRIITISTVPDQPGLKEVKSQVSWQLGDSRPQSTELITYLSDWQEEPLEEIDCFFVDVSGASIEQGAANKIIREVWIGAKCSTPVTLDKMILTWDKPNTLTKTRIAQVFVWQGSANTGNIIDITDTTLIPGAPNVEIDQLRWVGSILGTAITVEFIMLDGSSEVFIIPDFDEPVL
ncbi:MAG: hypothetical protein A2589_01620 [Candidatus Vogelbacteria bacterium RIFOXYD1_FULL_46_19]|uniref:Uncharacterized protein n=1 Tax=Candidatus Vogelbacteria bacterium RIFOXYD1_FULL_46_19 TaxID=1802439 RepID=A0A1G2QHN9_9BACT|nr:MAG: hypothetical protein A2589_01620 [Candidatus Vogelbacteria bacterium RIFOXYD1_FULL_46_19]